MIAFIDDHRAVYGVEPICNLLPIAPSRRDDQRPLQGRRHSPPRTVASFETVEFATLTWFNNRRLLQPIGNIPPAEAEARYYAMINQQKLAA
jgi:transposase InsO family protein